MVVTPSFRCSERISWRRWTRTIASSADSGSSSSSRPGEVASARARAMRCCCPPESWAGNLAPLPGRPTSFSSSSTRARDRRLRHLAVHQAVGDVVGDREVGKERVRLEDDAVVALGRRQDRDVAPGLEDAARGLRLQAGDDAQQGRLAAARRAEEADELALLDRQVDVGERLEGAERLSDALQAQVLGHGSRASARRPSEGSGPLGARDVTSSARTSRCSACSTRRGRAARLSAADLKSIFTSRLS